jgi:hypothetical protein
MIWQNWKVRGQVKNSRIKKIVTIVSADDLKILDRIKTIGPEIEHPEIFQIFKNQEFRYILQLIFEISPDVRFPVQLFLYDPEF